MIFNSRRNQHYHSQRSVRSNIDNGNYHHHQYNSGSPIILNGHGHQYSPSQFQASPINHNNNNSSNNSSKMRPASSYYEYETSPNPNGFYRKIEEQYNQIQINHKIINGSNSVRVGGSSQQRAPIPDTMKPHNRGPFITQVRVNF
jgi:hypothetical protein